jgi:glycosyltransferase involved in cell wall biosynthesis
MLVIPSLESGGAERVLARMANHWAEAGDDVTLVTLSSSANDTYSLEPRVRRIGLDLMRDSRQVAAALWNNLTRVRSLRRLLRKSRPDAVISFTDRMNVVTLLAARGLGLRIVVSERVDPSQHAAGRVWSLLRRWTYPRAAMIVVQTDTVREKVRAFAGACPVCVIPNAVSPPGPEAVERAAIVRDPAKRHIVAMGRLDPQKGFDLLIDAFTRMAAQFPQWSVRILGEGPERPRLEKLITDKKLGGRVTLCGWTAQPASALMGSDLFVLSSRYEGFPNALLEAMACGLPSIAFDCESGPAEIVRHETDGLLVPSGNVEQLAAAMSRLMSNDAVRARFGTAARAVCERFSSERFFERWEELLPTRVEAHRGLPESV